MQWSIRNASFRFAVEAQQQEDPGLQNSVSFSEINASSPVPGMYWASMSAGIDSRQILPSVTGPP